ncbi:hypothetical protein QYF61_021282 [Mycteria americana]|uniref:Ubiquitin carboxyl-terminal hydrolase n=1 Tax=Mycteria americana TaxID=33587 RepID=A0AAN7MTI7_MYCAM|nr:hypothetical protein QYF61_021282 [Mycteria americana]
MATTGNDSSIAEGMALRERILFPPEKLCMDWQQSQRAGAGLHNLGNMCFLNSVLQCLTYTPSLANYLLSHEHSQSCCQQGFCMMRIMEAHINDVLHSSASAIQPRAVISVFTRIGEHFEPGRQEDAHEFLRYTVDAMQRACLSGSSDLDTSSQATTIVHQIFGGFLRSRVMCLSCKADSNSYEAFLDIPLDIKAASSVTAALEGFVKPEQLDGENCFKCSKCDKMVAASKRFTIHCVPKVLTLCLKRFGDFTGGKIGKVVKYPEYLDLRPYTSQTAGEPLLYALYAVLVHRGGSCCAGHYFCYTKASNGLWYKMNDTSVDGCGIDTVLRQQAYLLFYVRCSDLRTGEGAYSSLAPSYARSFLSRGGATASRRKGQDLFTALFAGHGGGHGGLWGGQQLLCKSQQEPANPGRCTGGICRLAMPHLVRQARHRLLHVQKATCPVPCQPCDRVQHTMGEDNNKEERRFSPSSRCQRNSARERARSRSPQGGNDLHSWFVENTDYDHSAGRRRRRTSPPSHQRAPRDNIAPRPSNASLQLAPAPTKQSLPRQRERSRSPWLGNDLRSWFVDTMSYDHSAGRRRRTSHPSCDRTARDDTAPGPSNASSRSAPACRAAQEQTLLRQRERSRSPLWGSDCHSWFVVATDYDLSAGRRRRVSQEMQDGQTLGRRQW